MIEVDIFINSKIFDIQLFMQTLNHKNALFILIAFIGQVYSHFLVNTNLISYIHGE